MNAVTAFFRRLGRNKVVTQVCLVRKLFPVHERSASPTSALRDALKQIWSRPPIGARIRYCRIVCLHYIGARRMEGPCWCPWDRSSRFKSNLQWKGCWFHTEQILWKWHTYSQIQCHYLPTHFPVHHVFSSGLPLLPEPMRPCILEHHLPILTVSLSTSVQGAIELESPVDSKSLSQVWSLSTDDLGDLSIFVLLQIPSFESAECCSQYLRPWELQ